MLIGITLPAYTTHFTNAPMAMVDALAIVPDYMQWYTELREGRLLQARSVQEREQSLSAST